MQNELRTPKSLIPLNPRSTRNVLKKSDGTEHPPKQTHISHWKKDEDEKHGTNLNFQPKKWNESEKIKRFELLTPSGNIRSLPNVPSFKCHEALPKFKTSTFQHAWKRMQTRLFWKVR